MKLEKFKEKDTKKRFIVIFTVCCILLLAGVFLYTSFAVFTEDKNFNVINGAYQDPGDIYFAYYVDGQITRDMPSKNSGYLLDEEQSNCTNGVIPSWDNASWSFVGNYSNYTKTDYTRTKCNLYFTKTKTVSTVLGDLEVYTYTPDFTKSACDDATCESHEKGVFETTDDDGTSYYYRGSVENNYVYFANRYWRIIRINGDGTIRMIYDGTTAHPNGEASEDRQVGTSAYNTSRNDNAYVGYMYGTTGSSSYEETHANINDSTIKTVVDNWYKTNIEEAGYASYISDTLFCNDRSFASNNTETGAGISTTYYRWYNGPWTSGTNKTNPRLMCKEQNDRFTVEDTQMGNGDLTYPVGLLTTDEAALAGGYSATNSGYYLYTGNNYWTMSPSDFFGSIAYVRFVGSAGTLDSSFSVSASYGVQPVLNLKSGSLKSGSGTALDPYLV